MTKNRCSSFCFSMLWSTSENWGFKKGLKGGGTYEPLIVKPRIFANQNLSKKTQTTFLKGRDKK